MKNTKQTFVFDVDGTITPSREKISLPHHSFFKKFAYNNKVYILTGSDFPKTKEQLGDLTKDVMACYQCAGNETWHRDVLIESADNFVMSPLLETWCKTKLRLSKFKQRTGHLHLDIRPGMMNFSILGRGGTKQQREDYIVYDLVNQERQSLADEFNEMFKGTYQAQIAGETGIDICEEGRDKGQVFEKIMKHNSDSQIVFFGDDTQKGGNDYPFAVKLRDGDICHSISHPDETYKIMKSYESI